MRNYPSVFSIDVEDGISLVMRDVFKKPIDQTDRVVRTTNDILELLAKNNIKATFFILGMVGEKYPHLIRQIINQGHELAVHGHNHVKFFHMTPKQALDELVKAKNILEQISGQRVEGHRAPAFSISKQTPWAFDVLVKAGFKYDSSIMPIKSKYHGWEDFPAAITTVKTKNGSIIEFPISVINLFGKQLPFSGGGYLRLLPIWVLKNALRTVVSNKPGVIYVHPYEFDITPYPDYYFKEFKNIDWKKRLKLKTNFLNRSKSIKKVEELMNHYKFTTMLDIINTEGIIKNEIEILS